MIFTASRITNHESNSMNEIRGPQSSDDASSIEEAPLLSQKGNSSSSASADFVSNTPIKQWESTDTKLKTFKTVEKAAPQKPTKSELVNEIAKEMKGTSSRNGPDGGNNACAYMVRQVLAKAGYDLPELNSVDGLVAHLKKEGLVTEVPVEEAQPGDITYVPDAHIGLIIDDEKGKQKTLSNSSSQRSFSWVAETPDFDGAYGEKAHILRLKS